MMKNCPCGRDKSYQECCAIAHQNPMFIKTAEDLMRSRYSAYVLGMGEYLVSSHHPETRGGISVDDLEEYARSIDWRKLEIVRTENGKESDEIGIVEFKAFYKHKRKLRVQHEISLFKRFSGVWTYFGVHKG